jgi:DNA-directed RNA polymerase specialized sigma24 family protein
MAAAHGLTARQIAETEGIPVATAKSRIRHP